MATIKTKRLTRQKLAEFLPNQEAIKAFENLQEDVMETIPVIVEDTASNANNLVAADMFRAKAPVLMPSAADSQSLQAAAIFLPHMQQHAQPPDDARNILATQIFGA